VAEVCTKTVESNNTVLDE